MSERSKLLTFLANGGKLLMNSRKLGMVALIVTLSAFSLTVHAANTPITDGLVGWWQFNEPSGLRAADSSGKGNDGILAGAASFSNDPTRGNVVNVYGISGEVDYPSTTDLQPVTGTISVWLKPTVANTSDVVRQNTDLLVKCNFATKAYAYNLRVDAKGTPIAIIANDNPKTCSKGNQVVVAGPSNLVKLNQWTHVAMEWNGRTVYVFVNGRQVASGAYVATPGLGLSYHGNDPTKVAKAIWDFNTGYLEYAGQLSDLRIYSRALSAAEIANIALNGQ
jgi:hypothetical protein